MDLEHVGYTSSECSVQVIDYLFLAVFLLGVFTNVLNVSIAIKLYLISVSSRQLAGFFLKNEKISEILKPPLLPSFKNKKQKSCLPVLTVMFSRLDCSFGDFK